MNVLGGGLASTLISKWDTLRGSYWFLPMLMVGFAVALAVGLVELDARVASRVAKRLPWIQDTEANGTRALLSTVAGSMITVTGVVFSITIVALTLASSQFGPRMLRNFLRDRGNQLVLGTFVATFVYSLLVLRAVEDERVPYIATAVAIVLSINSVFVLIYFVHHAASSIQASSVIDNVAREIDAELPHLFPETLGSGTSETSYRDASRRAAVADAQEIFSSATGYVRVLDTEGIFELACEADLLVDLVARPGDFVIEDGLLARVSPAGKVSEVEAKRIADGFVVGPQRTAVQDVGFLTDQLAEMAVRALSPGINDPKTAIACIHRLGAVIAKVASREMPSPERCDESGQLRVVARATTFAGIVASCLDPIRRYGAADAEVVEAALLAIAGAIERCSMAGRRETLLEHAREWRDEFARSEAGSKRDRTLVDEALALLQARVEEQQS